MRLLSYAFVIAGLLWGLRIASVESPAPGAGAPVAALLGAGMVLLTTDSVRIGSVRGAQRRISRDDQPGTFWFAIAVHAAAAAALLVGAVVLFTRS